MTPTFSRAIVRIPGPSMCDGLTTQSLGPPDHALALEQHGQYVEALKSCGLDVTVLPPEQDHPDACFVEDTAVLVPEAAVITNPGARSRKGETESMVPAVAVFYPAPERMEAPATLDGGDVMQVGRTVYVGLSDRTNEAGADRLGELLAPHGYALVKVPLAGGLHLKSDVNWLGGKTLLLTPAFAERAEFADYERLVVPKGEEYAANCLLINDRLLVPDGFPGVKALVEPLGFDLIMLQMSEYRKIDGGLSCLSLRF